MYFIVPFSSCSLVRRELPLLLYKTIDHQINKCWRNKGLALLEVSLVQVSSCGNTESKRDDLYWTSRTNSLELIELSSINKVSLV
jgi:hypothetical protein